MAKSNPFRFSNKYQDDETDLLYYGYRCYAASTGRWLSRDPIGEKGGINLYCNVRNNPISNFDSLGLEESKYTYQESAAYGLWLVRLGDVTWLDASDNPVTLKGFHSTYMPFIFTQVGPLSCPCSVNNLILVQAISGSTWLGNKQEPHMDIFTDRTGNNHYPYHDSNTPIPNYTDPGYLTIKDAPHATQSDNASGAWEVEDCAVCRVNGRNSVTDTVYGCVKFVFRIDNRGGRTISVESNGAMVSGKSAVLVPAEKPGKTWKKALERWRIPGNTM